ncbi:MAG UNVERIFIED_CONTAM: hypothetical protein LVR18_37520 [Planctomycetaceae bacterium]
MSCIRALLCVYMPAIVDPSGRLRAVEHQRRQRQAARLQAVLVARQSAGAAASSRNAAMTDDANAAGGSIRQEVGGRVSGAVELGPLAGYVKPMGGSTSLKHSCPQRVNSG